MGQLHEINIYNHSFPLQTGDEMSKRSKFLMLTWVGTEVSPIKKAKMSTDKALVKEVLAVSSIYAFVLCLKTLS